MKENRFKNIFEIFILKEIWDVARRISCPFSGSGSEKTIAFKPFTVDTLEVVSVPVSTGRATIDCWMDIQRGTYPNVSTEMTD